jgi:preprotein translocase subunit SecD
MQLFKVLILATSLVFLPIKGFAKNVEKKLYNHIEFQVIQDQLNFDNNSIKTASLSVNKDGSYSGLEIELKPSASNDLNRVTTANVGKVVNLVINGRIITSATIQSPLQNKFLIAGITKDEAQKFIDSLKNG